MKTSMICNYIYPIISYYAINHRIQPLLAGNWTLPYLGDHDASNPLRNQALFLYPLMAMIDIYCTPKKDRKRKTCHQTRVKLDCHHIFYIYICIVIYIYSYLYIYIHTYRYTWANHSDLTVTSLESWSVKQIIPNVNYWYLNNILYYYIILIDYINRLY